MASLRALTTVGLLPAGAAGASSASRSAALLPVTASSNCSMRRGFTPATESAGSDMGLHLPCPSVAPHSPEEASCIRLLGNVSAHSHGGSAAQGSSREPSLVHEKERALAVGVGLQKAVKFTAEKARLLREKTRESESHHDFMYHSGLASRLA